MLTIPAYTYADVETRRDTRDRLICLFDASMCVYGVGGLALSGKQSSKGIRGGTNGGENGARWH